MKGRRKEKEENRAMYKDRRGEQSITVDCVQYMPCLQGQDDPETSPTRSCISLVPMQRK